MFVASKTGKNEIVKLLLKRGADWSINTKKGKTAIDLGIFQN